MQKPLPSEHASELLEELLTGRILPDAEQSGLRALVALQVSLAAAARPDLTAPDRSVLALLLARWQHAWTIREILDDEGFGGFEVSAISVGNVCRLSPETTSDSLHRLESVGMIEMTPAAEGSEPRFRMAVDGAIHQIAGEAYALAHHDFVDRHQGELRGMAADFLDVIEGEITDLLDEGADAPRALRLQFDFLAFRQRTTFEHLLQNFAAKPDVVYAWFDELAELQQRGALIAACPNRCSLKGDLVRLEGERIAILSGRYSPLITPANAA